jgi:hypothetical protein
MEKFDRQTVRIQIPASVAFDLGKLTKAIGNVLESLGCRPCFSGADCTFRLARDFVVDPKTLALAGVAPAGRPTIGTWPTPERAVQVALPASVAYDAKKIPPLVKDLVGRLAHPACHSGFDITYRLQRDYIVNAKTLGVESVGGGIIVEG